MIYFVQEAICKSQISHRKSSRVIRVYNLLVTDLNIGTTEMKKHVTYFFVTVPMGHVTCWSVVNKKPRSESQVSVAFTSSRTICREQLDECLFTRPPVKIFLDHSSVPLAY